SIYAFDATGTTNCTGSPKTCNPLWSTAVTGSPQYFGTPVVVGGHLFGAGQDNAIRVYDATGATNCSGTPKTCTPLFTAVTNNNPLYPGLLPAVANGTLFVDAWDGTLYAFDATGITNCSGIPKTCSPLW